MTGFVGRLCGYSEVYSPLLFIKDRPSYRNYFVVVESRLARPVFGPKSEEEEPQIRDFSRSHRLFCLSVLALSLGVI